MIETVEMRQKAVLLADDNENDVMLMKTAFESAGISEPLIIVRDGQDAISYLGGEGGYANRQVFPWPSLLILDLNMPRKNGFDVLRWLKSCDELPGLSVVVMSSSREESDVQNALRLGADDYHVKPNDFQALVVLVKHLTEYWLNPHLAGSDH